MLISMPASLNISRYEPSLYSLKLTKRFILELTSILAQRTQGGVSAVDSGSLDADSVESRLNDDILLGVNCPANLLPGS